MHQVDQVTICHAGTPLISSNGSRLESACVVCVAGRVVPCVPLSPGHSMPKEPSSTFLILFILEGRTSRRLFFLTVPSFRLSFDALFLDWQTKWERRRSPSEAKLGTRHVDSRFRENEPGQRPHIILGIECNRNLKMLSSLPFKNALSRRDSRR
jgi:hypothetical protein